MLLSSYRCQALPLYGSLIVRDTSLIGEETDLGQALQDAVLSAIGASRLRIAIRAAQDSAAIEVQLQLWNNRPTGPPDNTWHGPRTLLVEFPHGSMTVENISAGPIPLQPGAVEHLDLPGGPGLFNIAAWHRGRETATARVNQLWEADEAEQDITAQYAQLAGIEAYLLQIWHA